MTFRSPSPGSHPHLATGSSLQPGLPRGEATFLSFSERLGQGLGCFKHKAWSLQRLCCWSDKAAMAGGPGAATQMVELGGRTRSWALCRPREYVTQGSPGVPCGMTCPGTLHIPSLWSAHGSEPVPADYCFVDGLWVSGCRENPAARLHVQQLDGCRVRGLPVPGDSPSITLGLHGDELCLCLLQVPCCHTVPRHPPCMSPNARMVSPPSPLPLSFFLAHA